MATTEQVRPTVTAPVTDWRTYHEDGLCFYKYENDVPTGVPVPTNYCIVMKFENSTARGFAIAVDWRNTSSNALYVSTKHGADNWNAWEALTLA